MSEIGRFGGLGIEERRKEEGVVNFVVVFSWISVRRGGHHNTSEEMGNILFSY